MGHRAPNKPPRAEGICVLKDDPQSQMSFSLLLDGAPGDDFVPCSLKRSVEKSKGMLQRLPSCRDGEGWDVTALGKVMEPNFYW